VHGKDSRTTVNTNIADLPLVHFTTGLGVAIEDVNLPAGDCEIDRGRQSAGASANNDRRL
jgi:hypothetical protein